jgi:farnesyl diphosphate synthase
MFALAAESAGAGFTFAEVTRLQAMKTGRLFRFCCEAGAILGGAPPAARRVLLAYAEDFGLAFQIADDLLDAEGSEAETGKRVGKDASAGKATFLTHLGAEGARAKANALINRAASHLDMFTDKSQILREVARFVVERRS